MSYVPKYIIKRIVPADALANYDVSGDGTPDHVGLKYVNVLAPMEIPQDATFEGLMDQLRGIYVDDTKIENVDQGQIWYDGKKYSKDNFNEMVGQTLPIGGQILILLPYSGGLQVGMHKLKIETSYEGQDSASEVERELAESRICLPSPGK